MVDPLQSMILFLLIVLIVIAGRALWMLIQIKSQVFKSLKSTYAEINAHIQTPGLHRNSDFDARVARIETRLDKVEENNGRLL